MDFWFKYNILAFENRQTISQSAILHMDKNLNYNNIFRWNFLIYCDHLKFLTLRRVLTVVQYHIGFHLSLWSSTFEQKLATLLALQRNTNHDVKIIHNTVYSIRGAPQKMYSSRPDFIAIVEHNVGGDNVYHLLIHKDNTVFVRFSAGGETYQRQTNKQTQRNSHIQTELKLKNMKSNNWDWEFTTCYSSR